MHAHLNDVLQLRAAVSYGMHMQGLNCMPTTYHGTMHACASATPSRGLHTAKS